MSEQNIFLVVAEYPYEGNDPVECYLNEADAQAQVDRLNALAESSPKCPDADAPDAVWETFLAAQNEWYAKHPLGDRARGYLTQRYAVTPLPLRTVR